MKEKWTADFSSPEKSCFDIKAEISCNAYLEKDPIRLKSALSKKGPHLSKGALFFGLKKKSCMAWIETPRHTYRDQYIDAVFRFEGGYCAAGLMFRMNGQREGKNESYYLALVSSKGYFRLDVINNAVPRPLIGWTQVYDEQSADLRSESGEDSIPNKKNVNLGIIARADHFIFTIDGKWAAEAYDASIPGGHLGFALVSYDSDIPDPVNTKEVNYPPEIRSEDCVCRAWLYSLSVDSRVAAVDAKYKKWTGDGSLVSVAMIDAECRRRLAESFAALDRPHAAHDQILKAWKQREETARSILPTFTEMRAKEELLFAARMTARLGQFETAEEYIDAYLAMCETSRAQGKPASEGEFSALAEKAKLLSSMKRFEELAAFLTCYIKQADSIEQTDADLPPLYALLGHAHWNLKDHKAAAAAWDTAFSLDKNNGLYAVHAANAWELLGKKSEAFKRRLAGGECFLRQQDYAELEALVPKLLGAGKKDPQARELVEKWAAIAGGASPAETKLAVADSLKPAVKKKSAGAKPAVSKPVEIQKPQKAKTPAAKMPADKKPVPRPTNKNSKKPAEAAKPADKKAGKKPKNLNVT